MTEHPHIKIVDVADVSHERACNWFNGEAPSSELKLETYHDISELSESLDLVVVSTSSAVRCTVTEALLKEKQVRNLILEKVLFQKEADYVEIDHIIKNHSCKI